MIQDLINETEEARARREEKFRENFLFGLDGVQWEEDEKPVGKKSIITFNQTQDYIDIYMAKIFPVNPYTGERTIGVKCYDKNKGQEYEKEITKTYEKNELIIKIEEQLTNFFYGGAACLYYPMDISGKTKIYSINPTQVCFKYDDDEISELAIIDEISIKKENKWLEKLIRNLGIESKKKYKRITYWNKEIQAVTIEDEIRVAENQEKKIPFSWIPNNPKPHEKEGRSEIEKTRKLEKEFNFRISDLAQRIRENTEPILATFSDNEISIERDERGILKMGKDDDAKFLTVPEAIENMKLCEKIEDRIKIKMGINEAVLGKLKSNISRMAMQYYFSTLLDKIAKKRIYWDKAFRELNRTILKRKFKKGNFSNSPVYNQAIFNDENMKSNTIFQHCLIKLQKKEFTGIKHLGN